MIRVAAVGDVHFAPDVAGTLRPGLAKVGQEADVLLLAGDLTRLGVPEEAEALASELEGLAVPAYAVLGNHDVHAGRTEEVVAAVEGAGVAVLEGTAAVVDLGERGRLGIAGVKGFGVGFPGATASDFGEPEMRAFHRVARESADHLCEALTSLAVDRRVALMHYAPVPDTLEGEKREIWAFLGSHLLGEAIDVAGADLAVHGHAHAGAECGTTPGGVPVRNVAQPLIRAAYRVYEV